MPVASFTSFIGDHSVYAVFGLMVVAAVYDVLVLARRTDWNLHGPDELAG